MVLELEKHFKFWADKINTVHEEAIRTLKELEGNQAHDRVFFNDLQHSLHHLVPFMKPVTENKQIEKQLVNMNEYFCITKVKRCSTHENNQ